MSYQAQSTFGMLYVGGVSRKAVLQACANYADDEMRVFAKTRTIAKDTDQSLDTARRRLHELEDLGTLVRFPQWVDDDGKINKEGRGRRISDEIRMIPTAKQGDIDARAKAMGLRWRKDDGEPDEDPDDDAGPSNLQGPSSGAAAIVDPSDPSNLQGPAPSNSEYLQGRPLHCGKGPNESLPESKKDSPPYPPAGGCEADHDREGEASEAVDGWSEFKKEFEADGEPIVKVSIAKQLVAALSIEERKRLTVAASGLIVWRKRQKKPSAKPSAQTFVREMDAWPSWAQHAPPPPAPPVRFIAADDPEFKARRVLDALIGREPRQPVDCPGQGSGCLIAAHPATPDLLALAAFGPFRVEWHLIEDDDNNRTQIAAWRERVRKWTNSVGELHAERTRAEGLIEHNGQQLPRWSTSYPVPCPWPPRKDGTISVATGPPEISKEDADALSKN